MSVAQENLLCTCAHCFYSNSKYATDEFQSLLEIVSKICAFNSSIHGAWIHMKHMHTVSGAGKNANHLLLVWLLALKKFSSFLQNFFSWNFSQLWMQYYWHILVQTWDPQWNCIFSIAWKQTLHKMCFALSFSINIAILHQQSAMFKLDSSTAGAMKQPSMVTMDES